MTGGFRAFWLLINIYHIIYIYIYICVYIYTYIYIYSVSVSDIEKVDWSSFWNGSTQGSFWKWTCATEWAILTDACSGLFGVWMRARQEANPKCVNLHPGCGIACNPSKRPTPILDKVWLSYIKPRSNWRKVLVRHTYKFELEDGNQASDTNTTHRRTQIPVVCRRKIYLSLSSAFIQKH